VLQRFGVDRSRRIITQISRFGIWTRGVIKGINGRGHASSWCWPAAAPATIEAQGDGGRAAAARTRISSYFSTPASVEINALQRASTVVLQKSLKEGFGLTVSEALWKGKPVIASAVGGIPLQITHKFSGILTRTIDGTAYWIKQLIHEPEYARQLGVNGREHIKNNFLITRHIKDYLLAFLSLAHKGDIVHL
jgi:trehalose synthase